MEKEDKMGTQAVFWIDASAFFDIKNIIRAENR